MAGRERMPAREPIKPVPGRQLRPADVTGTIIIASRTHLDDVTDSALRIFTGNVDGRHVGDTFDAVHRDNGRACGQGTIQAIITDGHITAGTINDGIRSYRVNELG
jgi:hypothetical protein